MSAPHARTRERALALYDIAQGSCATRVAARTGRHPQTLMGWVPAYNAQGPGPLGFRRPGGRRPTPLCAQIAAALRDAVCAAQRTAATPPREGADPAPRWTLKRLVLSVRERFGRRCCRETIRTALHRLTLSWKHAVVEESQEAARPGQPRAAAGLCRASPGRARRRSTRSASLGLCGRGAPPSGRGPRLWLGRAPRALLGRLTLARPVGAGLVLWAVSLQRGPGAARALSAGQWRPHDRGAAAPAGRGS